MTPEQQAKLDSVEKKLNDFLDIYYRSHYPDKTLELKELVIKNKLTLDDGINIPVGGTLGTKIGTSTTQKLGFFNKTPIIQVSAITSPTGGTTIDTQARTAIDAIRTALTALGLTA